MKKNATSHAKKFTLEELRQAFAKLVLELEAGELEELRAWLEGSCGRKLSTTDDLALGWIRVVASELRDRAELAILELEPIR